MVCVFRFPRNKDVSTAVTKTKERLYTLAIYMTLLVPDNVLLIKMYLD